MLKGVETHFLMFGVGGVHQQFSELLDFSHDGLIVCQSRL